MAHTSYPRETPDIFWLAVANPALFRMILCNSALHINLINGKGESDESALYKLEATRDIQHSLQTDCTVSDALIAAVACLAKVEVSIIP